MTDPEVGAPRPDVIANVATSAAVGQMAAAGTVDLAESATPTTPAEPLRRYELARWLNLPLATVVDDVRRLQGEYPELFWPDDDGALVCAPQVVSLLRGSEGAELANTVPVVTVNNEQQTAARKQRITKEQQQNAIQKFVDFGEEMKAGETVDAQTFAKLIGIFGAESAFDVLYRFHENSQDKVPMPVVRSFLADYLGEFVLTPGKIDWDNLGEALPYLDDVKLRNTLMNIIKRDCLRSYNLKKKADPNVDDFTVVAEYLALASANIEELENKHLNEVVQEVERYYEEVFFFDIPEQIVDSIKKGRPFPDLNQRVNIYEALEEKRFLFGDAPGMGKSASAILTKELSGSKLALVLTPSSVFAKGVWQEYLSAAVNEKGKQVGYFKPGEEPRVLVVNAASDLEGINSEDYDYVVMSSDRIDKDEYFNALQAVDFDMMIVDEAHTFKNIIEGKRAANLIELSGKLGPEEYLLMLTATPAPNKVEDIALSLRLMYPDKFKDHSNADLVQSIIQGDILEIRSLLLPKMQCKNLEDTREVSVSPEQFVPIELTGPHKLAYEVMLDEWELEPREKLQFLRQILMNPAMLDGTPGIPSAKLDAIHADLDELFLTRKKAVIFINGYVRDIIESTAELGEADITILPHLEIPGVSTEVIHGGVRSGNTRNDILDRFQTSRSPMLLVVSGQTVSVGVDLSAADAAIQYNEPWTVAEKSQQFGRSERPGRTGKLAKWTYVFRGTIEEGIHKYIEAKNRAVNKLLHGVPITEAEKSLVANAERSDEAGLEVNPELAQYYYSAIDRMNKIFGRVKEIGEDEFRRFLDADDERYAKEYASTYQDLTSRSYQANSSRMACTIIDQLEAERESVELRAERVILDVGSGPEMLRRHIPEQLRENVISVDINSKHFEHAEGPHIVGTMRQTKVEDESVDYLNLSLALHYTAWQPKKGNFERLEALGEINRVLKVGGTAIIAMPYSMDVRDKTAFAEMVARLGLRVIESYSGTVTAGQHFTSHVITLRKEKTVKLGDPKLFMATVGPPATANDALRFTKRDVQLRDQRRMATSYTFEASKIVLGAQLNATDAAILEEETALLREMAALRAATPTSKIEEIPASEILKRGFSRIFNGKKYLLFKHLTRGAGAVTYRD